MFNFIIGACLIIIGIGFVKDAVLVYRGVVGDKDGKLLWVYRSLKKKVPIAKDRSQALVFTIMSSFLSVSLGVILMIPLLRSFFQG